MKPEDVRINPTLNTSIWKHGIRHVPHKVRLVLSRKQEDDKWVSEVDIARDVTTFDELKTEKLE